MRISDWGSDVCSSDLSPSGCRRPLAPSGVASARAQRNTQHRGAIMTLVPLVEGDDFASDDQTAMQAARSGYGQLLYTWQAIANSPGLFSAYLPFLQKVAGFGDLDVQLKILVALRVAVLNRSEEHTSELQSLMRISY